jgi:hypothetical protein
MTTDEVAAYCNEHVDEVAQVSKLEGGQSLIIPTCSRCHMFDIGYVMDYLKRQTGNG